MLIMLVIIYILLNLVRLKFNMVYKIILNTIKNKENMKILNIKNIINTFHYRNYNKANILEKKRLYNF